MDFKNYSTVANLIDVCEFEYTDNWVQFKERTTLNNLQMMQFCDRNVNSMFTVMVQAQEALRIQYNCTISKKCSDYELALKQWINSSITLNPIPELGLPASLTLNSWLPDVPSF